MKRNSTITIRILASLAGLLALCASRFTYAGPGQFTDVTEIAGVQYIQHQLDQTQLSEQEIFSGSAAAGDYDGDGWVDLFVTRLDGTDILFRNLGGELDPEEPVRFEDVTHSAGIKLNLSTNGGAWGDIDNDGDLDLYIGSINYTQFYLYVNNGDGTMDLYSRYIVGWSISAANDS